MLKHFTNPPNWFTMASIFCGFWAIVLAAGNPGDPDVFYRAGLLICFAGVFDMLDGPLARITGRGSDFGVQLDSLADMVSFGLAPAVLVYSWGLHALGLLGLVASFGYALCASMRLARFNAKADGETKAVGEGLATTMAGGTLAAMVMTHAALGKTFVANPTAPLMLTVAFSLLMVSSIPYRLFRSIRRSPVSVAMLAAFFGLGILLEVRYDIALWFLGSGLVYSFSGVAELLSRAGLFHPRAAGHGITVDFEDDDL